MAPRPLRCLLAAALLAASAACRSPSPVDERLEDLVATMAEGLDTTEPSAHFTRRMEAATVFGGSYDWHSCVIAHWALLTHARVMGDVEASADLCARLSPEALAREPELLATRDRRLRGTAPYDEAWLCMLLAERERHARSPEERGALLAVRARQERRVVDQLASSPFPEGIPPVERGGSGFCGFYRSWLWAWLLLRWSGPVDPRTEVLLELWRRERIEPQRDAIAALSGSHGYDFLSVPAVLALVDRAGGSPRAYSAPAFEGWPEAVELRTVHMLGLELCRVWPCAADGDAASHQAWLDRTASLLARDELWRGDFAVVSHWVPQFLFIGWWLQHGRP